MYDKLCFDCLYTYYNISPWNQFLYERQHCVCGDQHTNVKSYCNKPQISTSPNYFLEANSFVSGETGKIWSLLYCYEKLAQLEICLK